MVDIGVSFFLTKLCRTALAGSTNRAAFSATGNEKITMKKGVSTAEISLGTAKVHRVRRFHKAALKNPRIMRITTN
jgi:hypothetical protein